MKLTNDQCKDIVSALYQKGKSPAAKILASWNSFGGRIGQYSHEVQYSSAKKPRKFDMYELRRKFGDCNIIVEIYIPGMRGWNDWIPAKTVYSTDLEDVAKDCTYDCGVSINIWKIPATVLKKLEKESQA